MAREVIDEITVKYAAVGRHDGSRDVFQVRMDYTALPPRKAEQGAGAPRKKRGHNFANKVHYTTTLSFLYKKINYIT